MFLIEEHTLSTSAVFLGAALSIGLAFIINQMHMVPRSVIPLYGLTLTALLVSPRFIYRWLKDVKGNQTKGIRVLIVGAGQAGEGIIRDMLRDRQHFYNPVAIVDDNWKKHKWEIHGIRVVGNINDIPKVTEDYAVEMIIIAMASASAQVMKTIVNQAETANLPYRTLPGLNDLVEGRVTINAIREVSLEDLLGRDPVKLDWPHIKIGIESKIVLVTGGGGSIGSELCRQIASLNPKQLIIVEQNEFNLYSLEQQLISKFPHLDFHGYLTDVVDKTALTQIFDQHQPKIVFHAAAYKHVPLLEKQIRAAVSNNVFGTKVLAETAIEFNVDKFILISTDKAVNPTNVMGATKRLAELFCQSVDDLVETQFITVRFGNVLDSAGSVVPLFKKQIEAGGPLTVTHPDITRFFMTIPEASQLILQGAVLGQGGEIFVLDMGKPIKIKQLAEQMIQLAGYEPEDIKIKYVGLRPGEKMHEELFYIEEVKIETTHKKIFRAVARKFEYQKLLEILAKMKIAYKTNQDELLLEFLKAVVPEFKVEMEETSAEEVQKTSG